jgi:hypothetical protein
MKEISNGHRALWMVLITSLAVPFFAGLAAAALGIVHQILDLGILPIGDGTVGAFAARVFLLSSFPAAISAVALVPFVLQRGTYGWLHAAVAGVLSYGVAAVVFPASFTGFRPAVAFAAGLLAVGMRALLINAGILKP